MIFLKDIFLRTIRVTYVDFLRKVFDGSAELQMGVFGNIFWTSPINAKNVYFSEDEGLSQPQMRIFKDIFCRTLRTIRTIRATCADFLRTFFYNFFRIWNFQTFLQNLNFYIYFLMDYRSHKRRLFKNIFSKC